MNKTIRHALAAYAATLLWVPQVATNAADFYVAPSDNDTNPGAQATPVQTIQRTSDIAQPGLVSVLAAKTDHWGEEAIRQSEGPSYDYFAKLLPPLRYVNATFRYYPIVLSAPRHPVKARLVSNGSAINARGGGSTWSDVGFPITFRVGQDEEVYGNALQRLDGPRYFRGYLPMVEMVYCSAGASYGLEVFAAAEGPQADSGVVFARFTLLEGESGRVAAAVDFNGQIRAEAQRLSNDKGQTLILFDSSWIWDASAKKLSARLSSGQSAAIGIFTQPSGREQQSFTSRVYDENRKACIRVWQSTIDAGVQLETPEAVVNNAWRSLMIGDYMLMKDDVINYSSANIYDRQFEAECGDVVSAMAMFGQKDDAKRSIVPLLGYMQENLDFHNAGFKLQMLAHYYSLTRDAEFVRTQRKHWDRDLSNILENRNAANGLLPREAYCGDIATQVNSLNSNANCWRGLRDWAWVLEELGETARATQVRNEAATFRQAILAAVEKSERRDFDPPFIPIALFHEEKPYETLTATKLGSYWCLMAPYVLGSGIFADTERERSIIDTLHTRGGVAMGMVRFDQHSGLFANENGVDDLYSLRYAMTLLRRDEVDRALVSFYGKLAQGLTRDTFIGGEGTCLTSLDEFGRAMYLPPNSAGNAFFLWTLRNLLVQDGDPDNDGKPATLRLLFATPRTWLADGKTIRFERAPTAFGEISIVAHSLLNRNEISVDVSAPPRAPKQSLLRIRPPAGWRVVGARTGKTALTPDAHGTVDITGLRDKFTVQFEVIKGQ
jgi:hypothetical protein